MPDTAALQELHEWKQAAGVEAGLRREFLARAEKAEAENTRLRALLSDPAYIRMKADYNRGHLSWANMIEERERGLGLRDSCGEKMA